jgi:polar amino acid transport system permease protein
VTIGALGLFVLFLRLSSYRWKPGVLVPWIPHFLRGLLWTLIVSAGALVFSMVLGVAAGLGRLSRNVVTNQLATIYVEIVRGTPLLAQILITYFVIAPMVGFHDKVLAGILALGLFAGAYVAEIVRGGVESIDRGQIEAARSLGLRHRQALRHVILPQAVRRIIPPLTGQFVSLVKDSSLLSVMGVIELMKAADEVRAWSFRSHEPYLALALLYLAVTLPLSAFTNRLDRRLNPTRRGIHV